MVDLSPVLTTAAAQHGAISARQLDDLGVSEAAVRRLVASGVLRRCFRGVYVASGAPPSWEQDVAAACLAGPGRIVASHRSAARLHRLGPWVADDLVEVTTDRPGSPEPGGRRAHRSGDLADEHLVRVAGITVTTPARTLVDLGAVVPWWLVSRALEQLLVGRAVTVAEVEALVDQLSRKGRRGVGVLRRVLEQRALGHDVGDSGLEAVLAEIVQLYGLPRPVFQHELHVGGRWRRLDFAYPELRIAIEVDGFERHTQLDVFQDDRVRGNDLELAGWTVLHFTWAQIIHQPEYVASVIRRALTAAPTHRVA